MLNIASIIIKTIAVIIVLVAIYFGYLYWKNFNAEQKQESIKETRDLDDYFITGSPLVGADYDDT
jgi:uncharacterized protein YxeA